MTASVTVTDPNLHLIARAIAERVHPELIVLFGSRARGTARADSDYDLMVVVADSIDAEEAGQAANDAVRTIRVGKTILARPASEYQWRQQDPGFLDFMIAREGVVLYETGAVPQRSFPNRVRESDPGSGGLAMWLARAAADYRAADASLAADDPVTDAICFHSHAAVEKLLKALIVAHRRIFPPKTHDLAELLAMQHDHLRADAELVAACKTLNGLYPNSRYPEAAMPSLAEARSAAEASRVARDILMAQLPPPA